MFVSRLALAALMISSSIAPCLAAEGSSAAGVAGGSDLGSALLPPPGLYAAGIAAFSQTEDFYDGAGRFVPLLDGLSIDGGVAALAVLYVPDFEVLGGRFGLLGSVSRARECGTLSVFLPRKCTYGWGDPYVEVNWSRFFGTLRPSAEPTAYPIAEGLALQIGLGLVIPAGQYDPVDYATFGVSAGNNVWDVAPMLAATYTTPAIFGEGTELSAKVYWNNYRTNEATGYRTGDNVTVDFALTEHFGRLQIGIAGLYGKQIEDDRAFGFRVPPDGRRTDGLSLGPVIAIDLPELAGSLKIKGLRSLEERNAVSGQGIAITYGMKLY
ncbi:MAG: hypothetical protein GC150_10105 [Rhizobiales bacterium]|nr:hypothetical protein [Hyphomicrobiales bacterium]